MTDAFERLKQSLSDRYTIHHEIGHGGMATVYLAEDVRLGRKVAVKVLRPELAESLGTERFLREIGIAARLSHPNILPLHDSGEADGFLYYVMPYIEGETIRDRLMREKQLPVEDVVEITKEVSAALDYAHRQGVVHRDIKPENILIHEGKALVADFGIALAVSVAGGDRLTETGMVVGTPAYMSPEQSSGESHLDARSDVYSLATVVYEMLTGQPPFTGPTAQAIIARRLSETPPSIRVVRDGVSLGVEQVVHKALSRVPADRYKTAQEFAGALEKPEYVAPPKERRKWVGAAVAAAAVVLLGLGGVWVVRSGERSDGSYIDEDIVLVAPFRVADADEKISRWGKQMPLLFEMAMVGVPGMPGLVDPVEARRRIDEIAPGDTEPTQDELLAVAEELGAGYLVSGAILGTAEGVMLRGSMTRVGPGDVANATVAGPLDSVSVLGQRLAIQLLLAERELDKNIPSMAHVSVEALQAYFAGQEAFRDDRRATAIEFLNQALDIDSTFAQAALSLWASIAPDSYGSRETGAALARGKRLAERHLANLSEGDRDFVRMLRAYDDASTGRERFDSALAFAERWSNHPGVLRLLISSLTRDGPRVGYRDWRQAGFSALEKLKRLGAETKLTGFEPLRFAIIAGADSQALDFAEQYVQHDDSTLGTLHLLAYTLLGDSVGLERFWRQPTCNVGPLILHSLTIGLPLDAAERCAEHLDSVSLTPGNRNVALYFRSWLSFYRGREAEVTALMDTLVLNGFTINGWLLVAPVHYWLLGPGYDAAAARAVSMLDSIQWNNHFDRICYISLWHAVRGDSSRARRAIPTLDSIAIAHGLRWVDADCARLLEVLLEHRDTTNTEAPMLVRLDSIMKAEGWLRYGTVPWHMNLTIARLHALRGDWQEALAAVERKVFFDEGDAVPLLLIEGRAALALGDTARAIRAFDRYLTYRTDPDPGPIRQEWQQVQRELAVLVGERGGGQ